MDNHTDRTNMKNKNKVNLEYKCVPKIECQIDNKLINSIINKINTPTLFLQNAKVFYASQNKLTNTYLHGRFLVLRYVRLSRLTKMGRNR